jgi:LysM repeat protein
VERVCPLLGLASDRRSAIDGVDGAHRCHAEELPMPLERQMQSQLCLTPAHERCERYLAHLARAGRTVSTRAAIGDGLVSTRLLLAPEPAWRGIAGRARRAPRGSLIAAATATLAVGVGGIALAAAVVDGRIALGDATATPSPSTPASATPSSPPPTATVTPEPSVAPSPTVVPSPVVTPAPTPAPTPVPTAPPTPAPQQTYVVQEGDTLAAIAQQFGTTVEALQSANGISDPDEILIGQVLVIP